MAGQWHLDADTYLEMVRSEVPSYERLQATLAEATVGVDANRILDLGTGTGVTALEVLSRHPQAVLIGVDSSEEMLSHARFQMPDRTFLLQRLEDPLPAGPFDLVVSAFAIHHLDADGKQDLFRRMAEVLSPGGRFVMCDVVIPDHPVEQPVPIEPGVDLPSRVDEQLRWLTNAGLEPEVVFSEDDLAILTADRPLAVIS